MTDNPICICGHFRADHNDHTNPKCRMWVVWFFTDEPCDCPGFEADPKVSDQ
ncbi:Uncharacterised protein [Mycobacteroides abscessus subsp. abscessus]|uniref:hypothetical protein n=1 Tax=Mycobacteroides abscessus TaxID=36809 RepID=UPI000926A2E3|nr:hypothetical protein [Mycobacteroides abscessus]SIC55586.1 Uncharacterised protein [Mycobacteroides abscessus subsp. abscessus]SKU58211.1 Uncharacterised protein [Mycobacteroides abscessus subsp. abscessus]